MCERQIECEKGMTEIDYARETEKGMAEIDYERQIECERETDRM